MTSFLATLYCEESGCASMYLVYLCLLFCSYQIQSANRSYNRQKMAPFSTCCGRAHTVQNSEVNIMKLSELLAEAHFASKNTLLKRNTLHCYILLKRTVCFKLACYSLLFNTLYPSTHFASCILLLNTHSSSKNLAPQHTLL